MARILLITESWPLSETAEILRQAVRNAGYSPAVATREQPGAPAEAAVMRLSYEPPRSKGPLFSIRNTLFYDTAANPGNYAMLRDTLHLHLQEVHYDVVLILCPPEIYLKLCFWIDETFGIPVWVHLDERLPRPAGSGFGSWNRERLRRKYLSRARLISTAGQEQLAGITTHEGQTAGVLARDANDVRLRELQSGALLNLGTALERIARKPHG